MQAPYQIITILSIASQPVEIHGCPIVFAKRSATGPEGVDGRAEPGQGDSRLYRPRYKQPSLLNRSRDAACPPPYR